MNLLTTIPTTEKSRFQIFLVLMNSFIGNMTEDKFVTSPLTSRELDVLGLLLYYNWQYKTLSDNNRASYLHSSEIRKQIKAELGIDTNNYNNIISRLNQKVFILDKQPLYNSGVLNSYLSQDITVYEGIEFRFKPINE